MLQRIEEYANTTYGAQSEPRQQECFIFTAQEVCAPNLMQCKMNVEPLPQTMKQKHVIYKLDPVKPL